MSSAAAHAQLRTQDFLLATLPEVELMQTYMRESFQKKMAEKDNGSWRTEHAELWKGARDGETERERERERRERLALAVGGVWCSCGVRICRWTVGDVVGDWCGRWEAVASQIAFRSPANHGAPDGHERTYSRTYYATGCRRLSPSLPPHP